MRSVSRVDVAVASGAGLAFVVVDHARPLAWLSGLVLAATVLLRMQATVPAVILLTAAGPAYQLGGGRIDLLPPVVVVLVAYAVGRVDLPTFLRAGLVLLPVGTIALTPGDGHVSDVVAVWLFFILLPCLAGRGIARHVQARESLAEATRALADEQRRNAVLAAGEERLRVARELHDVLAHDISVMVIQAAAARRVAPRDPERALDALRAVEECGREALDETRRLVGVVRRAPGSVGLAGLDALVERIRHAGLTVSLEVTGPPDRVPVLMGEAAYRLVQEALTNALRHAPGCRARVRVDVGTGLVIEVANTVVGARSRPGSGRGLVGMRERLAPFGGELVAGPRPDGFEVRAVVPLPVVVPA